MVLGAQRRCLTFLWRLNLQLCLRRAGLEPGEQDALLLPSGHGVPFGHWQPPRAPKHSFLEDLSFQEEPEFPFPAGGQGALEPRGQLLKLGWERLLPPEAF